MFKIFYSVFLMTLFSTVVASPSQISTQLEIHSLEKIDDIVNQSLREFNIPGIAVGITVNDQIILSRGYGYRDVDQKYPVTDKTLFPIGSCTKAFTALLLGILVDEGKAHLDDPVKKYIPEFSLMDPNTTAQLTIRDLLTHRTGYERHDAIWYLSDVSRSDIVGLFRHLESVFGLRQEYRYNNFMYAIAGIVIERITHQSWEEAVVSRILIPLKMTNSNVSIDQLLAFSDYSLGYAELDKVITKVSFRKVDPVNPGGGINSNVVDLLKWAKLHLSEDSSNAILQKKTLQDLHNLQMPFSSVNTNEDYYQLGYGLGWFVCKFRDHDLITHAGHIDGFSAEVSFMPKEKIGIVILTNNSSDGMHAVAYLRNSILDRLLGLQPIDWMEKMQSIRSKIKQAVKDASKTFHEHAKILLSANLLQDYVGEYYHPAYGTVRISQQDQHLLASYGHTQFPMVAKSEDVFIGEFVDLLMYGVNPFADFTFFRDNSGQVQKLQIPFEAFRSAKPIVFSRR